MLIRGFLAMNGCYTGTAALVDTNAQTLISLTHVGRNGYFSFDLDSVSATVVLCGFPGSMLSGAEIAMAMTASRGLVYEASLPTAPGQFVYLNSASSCMQTLRRTHPALSDAEASALAKAHLFGLLIAPFLPGCSPGFLAHVQTQCAMEAMVTCDRFTPIASATGREHAARRAAELRA